MGNADRGTDEGNVERLADEIERLLTGTPRFFAEIVAFSPEGRYRELLKAWGIVRGRGRLERDQEGRYVVPASAPPMGDQA